MLKFKNKFKFGSSTPERPETASSAPDSAESRKTISLNSVADDMLKLTVSDSSTNLSNENAESSDDTRPGTPGSTPSVEADSSNPGLLTVKIYSSANIELPISINNNKQILNALANNSSNEATQQQLVKNLGSLSLKEQLLSPEQLLPGQNGPPEEVLSGLIAANFLPSNITIPSSDNRVKSLPYLTVEFDNNVLVIEPQKGTVHQLVWNQVVSFDVSKKAPSSGSRFLTLNLFLRLPAMLIPELEKTSKKHCFTSSGANIGDLLIGSVKVPLGLQNHTQPIRLMNHEYVKFGNANVEPADRLFGDIMLTVEFKPLLKTHLSINDFDLLKVIGKGSFGKVMQVVKKDTKQIYALKTLRKQHIISRLEVTHTLAERTVLSRINNPFIVPLKFSFQLPEKLYLVLSFINGGELFWHLLKESKFSMDRLRFYIAELLTALESLHEMNIIYRDLKPENILLDYQGHIALCDFGLCKLNMANDDKTNTFCGTPEYLAPELLLNQGYTRLVDWWTLGTLLYEMLTGLPPFYDEDTPTMYRKILQNELKFPLSLEGTDVQDLLIKLLQKDPSKRMSNSAEIKNHKFFKDIDWNKLLNKSYLPPFKPNVENLLDTSNFDQDFTNEKPQDSVVDDFLSESVQKQFGGWTYNGDNGL